MEDAEVVGTLRLPLGGMNGYLNVRGRQGRQNGVKDKYQGFTSDRRRCHKVQWCRIFKRIFLLSSPRIKLSPDGPAKQKGDDRKTFRTSDGA